MRRVSHLVTVAFLLTTTAMTANATIVGYDFSSGLPAGLGISDPGSNMVINQSLGFMAYDTVGQTTESTIYANGAPFGATWLNAEMTVTVFESANPLGVAVGNGQGASLYISNPSVKYMLAVGVADLGGGVYQTTVDLIDGFGVSPLLGTYILPDTTISQHRYNVEFDGSTLRVYVDGYQGDTPVITAAAPTGSGAAFYIGDILSSFNGQDPQAAAQFDSFYLSNSETLLPVPVPEPASMAILALGGLLMIKRRHD